MENELCCSDCADKLITNFNIEMGLCKDCIDCFYYEYYDYNYPIDSIDFVEQDW
jgi:hypothetical protein